MDFMSVPPLPLNEIIEPAGEQLAICPACKSSVKADDLSECLTCGGLQCGLLSNNCPATCNCDSLRGISSELIRHAEPILSEFCVHEKKQDCDRCFLRGKSAVHYIKDDAGRFVMISGAQEKFLQARCHENGKVRSIIGLTVFDLMGEAQAKPLVMQDMAVLETGKPQEIMQWLPDPSCPQSKMRQWFLSKRLMKMTDGRKFVVAVAYDITDFVEKNDQRKAQLVQCNKQHDA